MTAVNMPEGNNQTTDFSNMDSRIADFMKKDMYAQRFCILSNIKNPAILKHFMDGDIKPTDFPTYAIAAGMLDRNDVEWIKVHGEDLIPEGNNPKADPNAK